MYKVSTLKKRRGVLRRVLSGEQELFVCVETPRDLEELRSLVPPGKCIVVLGSNFYKSAARSLTEEEANKVLSLLDGYYVSFDTSVRNKMALYNLATIATYRPRDPKGLTKYATCFLFADELLHGQGGENEED